MTYIAKWCIAVGIIATTLWGGYTVDYSPSEFSFYKENGFDRIKAINFALIGEPGTPELPAVYLNYIIPSYAKVESLIVSQSNTNQIYGAYLVYPAQPPRVIGESIPWVDPDSLIYNSDELFPGEFVRIVSQGVMDGARIVTIEVRPLQYRPKSKRLFLVRNITFEFSFGPNTMPELRPQIRGKYEQAVYDAAIKQVVVNDYEIPVYYQKPLLVEENQLGSLVPYPTAPCVIITPDEFFNAFQPYADWLTDRGIRTCLISPQTIYNYFNGRDNAEEIRNYIKHCYQNAGGTYFILGGDDYFLPVRYGIPYESVQPGQQVYENDSVPCDMYFSDLSGEWNAENNGQGDDYWGEIIDDDADRFPEVYVGRITAYNVDEVNQWVDKVLNYEISPGNIGDDFITASWIYNHDLGHSSAWQNFPAQFNNHHHFFENPYAYPTAFNELNSGYGFVNVDCHGNIGDLRTRNIENDYSYIYSYYDSPNGYNMGLNQLSNQNQYYISYSWGCHTAAYDCHAHTHPHYPSGSDTCIADGFVDAYANRGASAYVGHTRSTLTGESKYFQEKFYEALFIPEYPDGENIGRPYSLLGVAVAISKCVYEGAWYALSVRQGCYAQNLFGSPATEAWTNIPGYMRVSHPRRIWVGVQTQFTVTVRDAGTNDYVPYAKVCLNKPEDIYEVGLTDLYGQITFRITPHSIGTLKVTVTRIHNYEEDYIQYYPSRTTCRVYDEGSGGEQASGSDKILPTVLCITEMPTILKKNALMKFGIPRQGDISISVYSAIGSRVKILRKDKVLPGYYREKMDVKELSSGVYFIVLKQDNDKVTKKFLLIK